jgi:AcrR family transcriptional regulator
MAVTKQKTGPEKVQKVTKGEQTKDRLMKCAEKAFSQKGYYETQVSDIVRLARVAKGTIYQYFKNKENIFITLLETYAREWEKTVALDIRDFTGEQPGVFYAKEYLRQRLVKTAQFFGENQDRTNIILRIGIGVNEEFEAVIKIVEEKILKVVLNDITTGQRLGYIPGDINLYIASNAIMGAILRINYNLFASSRKKPPPAEIGRLIDDAVNIISNALQMK